MAKQEFYEPKKRAAKQTGEQAQFNEPLTPYQDSHASQASDSAQQSLDNIDQVLAAEDEARKAKAPGGGDSQASTARNLQQAEAEGSTNTNKAEAESKATSGGRNKLRAAGSKLKSAFFGSKRRTAFTFIGGGTGVGVIGLILAFTGLYPAFVMQHLMQNVDGKSFVRYQVDMDGRNTKWIAAYIRLRMGEVDDPKLKPQDRDNILFRRYSAENLTIQWYRALRGTSSFEQQIFENEGIKFTSVAYRDGNQIKFRPGKVTINDKSIPFDLNQAEIDAIDRGDVNGFNGRLRDFVDVEVLQNDKEARRLIKQTVNEHTRWWQVAQRLYWRKSIQQATGVRDWRFFENTRNNVKEKKISVRNKIVAKAFPESSRSGKFIQCMFGITDCSKVNDDPSSPENRSALAPETPSCAAEPDNPACDTGKVEEQGDGKDKQKVDVKNDGSAQDGLKGGLGGDGTSDISKKLLSSLVSKISGGLSLLSVLDTLNHINNAMKNGSLVKLVYVARSTQYIGIYQVFHTAESQLKSGEASSPSEVNDMSQLAGGAGSSEGWDTVITPPGASASTASAAAFTPSKDKKEYCSSAHQTAMEDPKNAAAADDEFHYLCDSDKPGGKSAAQTVQNGWNESIGILLGPVFAAYNASGVSTIFGWFNSLTSILGVDDDAVQGILGAVGLKDTIQDLTSWATGEAARILGAGPKMSENTPRGRIINFIIAGGGALSEMQMRQMGAAATNQQTAALARQNVYAYNYRQGQDATVFDRYFSMSNPKSLLSKEVFAVSVNGIGKTIGSAFTGLANLPGLLINHQAAATDDDSYAVADWAGLNTYDFPKQCLDADPLDATPQSSTNAAQLGLIPADHITWQLLRDNKAYYDALYATNPSDDVVKQAYNCALLDDEVQGGLAAYHTTKTVDSNAYGYGQNQQ